jgi:serpin B
MMPELDSTLRDLVEGSVRPIDLDGIVAARRRARRQRRASVGVASLSIALAVAVTFATLTGSGSPRPTARAGIARSRLTRDTHPAVSPEMLNALQSGNTAAALDFYRQLARTPGNVFLSPYSVSTAIAMVAAGARGDTLAQMLAVLHAELPPNVLQSATNALNLALLAPRNPPPGTKGEPLQLQVANSVWTQANYHVERDFLDLLAREYGAALNTVDYARDPAGAVRAINQWVAENTNHKIPELLSRLDSLTRLVLVNAIYFKASWLRPFDANETRPGPFQTAMGSTVRVSFMHADTDLGYASGADWQAVDLPYTGHASMTVIVPNPGRFAAVERALDPAFLTHVVQSLWPSHLTLDLPKLHVDDRANMIPALRSLGMVDAFTPPPDPHSADFSGMNGHRDLYISQVEHRAIITVDERGTEAAAATGAVAELTSGGTRSLTIDRPFFFVIRDTTTNTILFMGRVTDPTQSTVQQP